VIASRKTVEKDVAGWNLDIKRAHLLKKFYIGGEIYTIRL